MKVHAGPLVGAVCASGLAGGATVAGVCAFVSIVTAIATWPPQDASVSLLLGFFFVIYAGVAALFAYVIGAVVAGIPIFLILNRAGWITPAHAAFAGAALSGLADFALGGIGGPIFAGLAALGGAVGGLAFRKVAISRD